MIPSYCTTQAFLWLHDLTLEYLYTNQNKLCFKVHASLSESRKLLRCGANAVTPFWRSQKGDLILAVYKLETARFARYRFYVCDVVFWLTRPRSRFLQPECRGVIMTRTRECE